MSTIGDKNSEYGLTQITAPSSRNGSLEEQRSSDYGAETELRRLLTTRHVTMIALGSSIGVGFWMGAGKSLAEGGPAAIFLGYVLAGSIVWAVSHSSGEMAVMYPVPSAFVQWVSSTC
jgi:amino acid transporter